MKKVFFILTYIFLMIGVLVVFPIFFLQNTAESEKMVFDDSWQIPILNSAGQKEYLPLDEIVLHALAGEMPANFQLEALKAQAITIRTYVLYHDQKRDRHSDVAVCSDFAHCHNYLSDAQLAEKEASLPYYYQAVKESSNQVLTYHGQLIDPVYHSTCGSQTENSEDYWSKTVPWLKSVACSWDQESPKYQTVKSLNLPEAAALLQVSVADLKKAKISLLSDSGRVKEVTVGQNILTGVEIRQKLDLNSTAFTWQLQGEQIIFQVKGYGHGVGLCQYGANGMAKAGFGAADILKHYYTGVQISQLQK